MSAVAFPDKITNLRDVNITEPPVGNSVLQYRSSNNKWEPVQTGWYDVTQFGAIGDGTTDNRAAFESAISALKAVGGGTLYIPYSASHYKVLKSILIKDASNIKIVSDGATLNFPSSATINITGDTDRTSQQIASSAFFIKNSNKISFEFINFQGDEAQSDININIGGAFYINNSSDVSIEKCSSSGGHFLSQDRTANDIGLYVNDNTIKNWRISAINPGIGSVISYNKFIQSTNTSYDRFGNLGSSHAIYGFAGVKNCVVMGNKFYNCREWCVKFSGSSLPIQSIAVIGNICDDCGGGVLFGDDTNLNNNHSNISITGNVFLNCGTNRAGWNQSNAIWILGSRNAGITGNNIEYTRDANASLLSSVAAIKVARYNSSATPVEDIIISKNIIHATIGTGFCTSASNAATYGINVTDIGVGTTLGGFVASYGSIKISNNEIKSVGTGIFAVTCVGLSVELNDFINVVTAININGCRTPIVRFNKLIPGANTSSNAQIRNTNCSFPTIYDNSTSGRLGLTQGKSFGVGDSNGGGTEVDFPLLGKTGRATPANGRPEIVFAYGYPSSWVNGDTVEVSGTVYTYQATSPTGNQFNTFTGLVALIEASTGWNCADYGADFSPTIVTNHARIRRESATATAYYVKVTCANPTAGMVLANQPSGNVMNCNARGGQASAPLSKVVVHSPLALWTSAIILNALNTDAVNQIKNNNFLHEKDTNFSGSSCLLEMGDTVGTPIYQWGLV